MIAPFHDHCLLVTVLVCNQIMVDNYAAFFNCTPVGRASVSMMAPLLILVGWSLSFSSVPWPTGFHLLRSFSKCLGAQGSPSSGSILNL